MKTLVTGAGGFIGSHLVDNLLNDGHEVTVIDNFSTGHFENLNHVSDRINLIKADISIKGDWLKSFEGIDWVIHLAALADIVPSIIEPEKYFYSNVLGTLNVLEISKVSNIKKFIYSASSSCYGIPDIFPTPEDSSKDPQYPYALTKMLGEEMVMHWGQVYNLPVISLRFFNVYGPRSRTSGTYGAMFGVFLAQKLANQPYTVVGDGSQTRDFTYVSDVVNSIMLSLSSRLKGKIFNVGSSKTISINKIIELLGGEVVYIPKRPGEPDCTFADISSIKKHLNWSPKVSIEEGVKLLLDNIDYWKSAPVWNPETISEATKDWFKFLGSGKKN